MGSGGKTGGSPVKYHATLEQVICMSPADAIVEIEINDEKAWVDPITDNREFYIDKPNLFGGNSSEGGVQGWCEARFGKPDQPKSSYLAEKISEVLSATRGVLSVVAKNFYLGNTPYAKPWHFRIKSTLKNADYSDVWYKEKSTISYALYSSEERFRHLIHLDDHKFLHATSNRDNDNLIGYYTDDKNLASLAFGGSITVRRLDVTNGLKQKYENKLVNTKFNVYGYARVPSDEVANVVFPRNMTGEYYDTSLYYTPYYCRDSNVSPYEFNSGSAWLTSQKYICENNQTYAIRLHGSTYDFSYSLGVVKINVDSHYGSTTVISSDTGTISRLTYCNCVFTDGLVAYYCQNPTSANKLTIYGYTNPEHGTAVNTHGHIITLPSTETFDCFGCDSENNVTYALTHNSSDEYHITLYSSVSGGELEQYTIPDTLPVSHVGENTYFLLTQNYMVCVCGDTVVTFIRNIESEDADYDGSQLDYNPAHAIREAITSKVWGLGKDESVIDDANFRAVADTLYNEKMGISFVFESDDKVSDFISEVLKVVGGTLRVDRATGLIQIKLFRADYDPADLLLFDTSNVLEISDVKRTALSESVNQVTCKYKNYKTGDDATVVYQDLALMQAQDEIINADFEYPYVYFPTVADKLAQRDLFEASGQFFSCTLKVGLVGRFLNLGDCVKLNFPHLGIDNLVFRIFKITYGGSASNEITMEIVQDKFYMPNSTGYVNPSDDVPDIPLPSNIEYIKTMELPYYCLYRFGEDIEDLLDRTSNTGGKVGVFISSYNTVRIDGADHYLSINNGDTWTSVGHTDKANFVSSCVTLSELDYLTGSFVYTHGSDLHKLDTSYVGIIDDEIIGVGEINTQNSTISIARGLFDTVPQKHEKGAVVYFFNMNGTGLYNQNDYVTGEYLFKFPYTQDKEVQSLNSCDNINTVMNARAYRPYPPACFRQNNEFFPDLKKFDLYYATALSWKERNRLTQLEDNYVLWTDTTDISAESGVQYELTMSNKSGSVNYVYTTTYTTSGLRLPCDIEGYARFAVRSYRVDNGVTTYSLQSSVIEGECRECTFELGINNYSQLTITVNTYYPLSVNVVNGEVIVSITDNNFATTLGFEDGILYRLVEL